MPTRYGSPDATIRTLPHRQPPVNRSMLRLLQNQAVGMDTTVTARGTTPRRKPRAHPAYAPPYRTGAALDHCDELEARTTMSRLRLDGVRVVFDDERAVSDAGVLL